MDKTKKDILDSLKALNNILKEKKREYENNTRIVKDETRMLKDKYINLYSNFKIGDKIIYTNFNGIEQKLIIHEINVRMTGTISYDIGDESSIMYSDISGTVLEKINEKN